MGYREGKHQRNGWSRLRIWMRCTQISIWCDGKEPDESDEEKTSKKKQKHDAQAQKKRSEGDDELEDIFQQLKRKHESKYSGPQLRLWA